MLFGPAAALALTTMRRPRSSLVDCSQIPARALKHRWTCWPLADLIQSTQRGRQ